MTLPIRHEFVKAINIACAIVATLFVGQSNAHHGFGGQYDTAHAIFLRGQVVAVTIAMPHPTVRLRVENNLGLPARDSRALPDASEFFATLTVRATDASTERVIEFPPVRLFLDLGPRIRVGDRVSVIAYQNCLSPHQLRGQWIQLASGATVLRQGRMHDLVNFSLRV